MIDEEIYNNIKEDLKKSDKRFITIPNPNKIEDTADRIDELMRDTIGVAVK